MKIQAFALASITVLATGAVASATPNIEAQFTSGSASSSTYSGAGSVTLPKTPVTIGAFSVTAFDATTTSPDASGAINGLSLEVTNSGSSSSYATINIFVSANGFTPSASQITVSGKDSFSTSAASTTDHVSFYEYADPGNGFFVRTVGSGQNPDVTTFTDGTPVSTYPNGISLNLTPNGAYSITDVFAVTLSGGSSTTFTFDNSASPTPEPASIGLMGLAGVGALLVGRRRKA